MKRHTVIGERILAAAPALLAIAPLVRSSHERLDGSGYPDGLRADEIPLSSRIVAVVGVDAYDAMATTRPYALPLTPDQAIDELRRCAGSQFDPTVVEAFVAVWQEARDDGAGNRPVDPAEIAA
jgi:two-component system, cell cycle response regulator